MKTKKPSHTSKYLRRFGFRLSEIAELLGMSIGSVHAHLQDEEKRGFLLRDLVIRQEQRSGYPGHYHLKRQRLLRLKEANGQCGICGDAAHVTHHIDGDKSNHSLGNLLPLCHPCHCQIEGKPHRRGKYLREYGMTRAEIFSLGVSNDMIAMLHRRGRLSAAIAALKKTEKKT